MTQSMSPGKANEVDPMSAQRQVKNQMYSMSARELDTNTNTNDFDGKEDVRKFKTSDNLEADAQAMDPN